MLLAIYAKNDKSDLRPAEKREIAGLLRAFVAQWRTQK
jgi:hypothetical protein